MTRKDAVADLFLDIRKDFGNPDGIIHSAGVIRDNFILRKTKAEFRDVLDPKVTGLVNLDKACKDIPLDFLILFSSWTGPMGNTGQADYACANAFMDAYAAYRNELADAGQRQGRTLSVNWPLWKQGGMRIDKEFEKMMWQSTGMIPMGTGTGISALYQGLASGRPRVMVTEGDIQKIREYLSGPAPGVRMCPTEPVVLQADQDLLREKTLHRLRLLFSEITKFGTDVIDPGEPLESYGIDSIMITQLNQKLAGIFGEMSKTLFYEYRTIGELAGHFIAEHPRECMRWTGFEDQIQPPEVYPPLLPSDEEFPLLRQVPEKKAGQRSSPVTGPGPESPTLIPGEPIAVIGMSGRYSRAGTLGEYWEILKTGRDCITGIPGERWTLEGFFHPDPDEAARQGKSYCKWGGFMEGFADFDPLFFRILPREAVTMDPQERIFVQSCWEVFEDAGYTRDRLKAQSDGNIGVFAGITKTGFDLYGPELWRQNEKIHPRTSFSSVANRISFLMDLKGPSMPVDTMCSSSLTAVHEACEHLIRGECEMAVAGGVNLYLHPSTYVFLCASQMLSPDGQCRSFGKGANGFVPGEGVGTVLLKRLSDAEKDHDHIYAVIRSTAVNHGGRTSGYTVPNPRAQGELVRRALDKAGINARTVSYIEAHGTGTELGDPIEITGLTQAFEKDTQETGFCAIGSAKSNIGHLEAAAGIAGVTKIILQMQNEKIVPTLHARELNPNIDFAKTPFTVQQELAEWKQMPGEGGEIPRRAGISSFGAGGANAHVVIEEYVREKTKTPGRKSGTKNQPHIIVLSARNEDRLGEQAEQLLADIRNRQRADTDLADIAYTLQVGREAMEERLAMTVTSARELVEKLAGFTGPGEDIQGLHRGQVRRNKDVLAAFAADEDMAKITDIWIAKGKYTKLLDLWVKGLSFDWDSLYGDEKPRRISLPTYPFARERYWISGQAETDKRHQAKPAEISLAGSASGAFMSWGIPPLRGVRGVFSPGMGVCPNTKNTPLTPLKGGISSGSPKLWIRPSASFEIKEKSAREQEDTEHLKKPSRVALSSPSEIMLSSAKDAASHMPAVSLCCYEQGVYRMECRAERNTPEGICREIRKSFKIIEQDRHASAVLLSACDFSFLSPGSPGTALEICHALTDCKVPVIAVTQGMTDTPAILAGLCSDIMILSEESRYQYCADDLEGILSKEQQAALLSRRFGPGFATEWVSHGLDCAGKELKAKGMTAQGHGPPAPHLSAGRLQGF